MSVRELVEGWMILRANTRPAETEISSFAGRVRSTVQNVTSYVGYMVTGRAFVGMADGVRSLAASMVQLNAQYEQQKIALTAMIGSQEIAADLMGDLEKMAAKTPFSQESIIQAAQSLRMYGFEADKLIPMLRTIGDAAAAAPEGMEFAVHRIVRALGQMRAKGRVMSQELNQLTEAGVPALQILQEKLGVTGAELAKMIESGKVSAGDGIRMILEGLGDRFGGMMEKQSQSLTGLISTAKDFGRIMLRDIGEPIFQLAKVELRNLVSWAEGGGFDRVREFAGYIRNLTNATIEWVRGPGGEMVFAVGKVTAAIGAFLASGMALKALLAAGLPLALSATVGAINAVAFATSPLGALLMTTAGALGILAAAFLRSAATGETFAESMTNVMQALTGLDKDLAATKGYLEFLKRMPGYDNFVALRDRINGDPAFRNSRESIDARKKMIETLNNELEETTKRKNRTFGAIGDDRIPDARLPQLRLEAKRLQNKERLLKMAIKDLEQSSDADLLKIRQGEFMDMKMRAADRQAAMQAVLPSLFRAARETASPLLGFLGKVGGGASGVAGSLAEMARTMFGNAVEFFANKAGESDEERMRRAALASRTAQFGGIAELNRSIQSRIKVDPAFKVEQDQLKELKIANKNSEKVEAAVKEVARGVGKFVAGFAS